MVFEATHEVLGRRAAVKILLPQCCLQPDLLRRFFDEARAANLLEHPSLVQIFECGQLEDGTAYLIMEYLSGLSLRARLKQGALPPFVSTRLGAQIAEALAAAHVKGIVHRDLKPENLMLIFDPAVPGRERIKVLDFGIAKLLDQRPQHLRTDANVVMGTPAYMSPEQCMGAGRVNFPSDVYSLGIILYEMVAGHPPFSGDGHGAVMVRHISDAVPALPEGGQSDAELNSLIMSMLAKDPERRPTMTAAASLLEQMAMAYFAESLPTPRRIRFFFKQGTQAMLERPAGARSRRLSSYTYRLLAGFLIVGAGITALALTQRSAQHPLRSLDGGMPFKSMVPSEAEARSAPVSVPVPAVPSATASAVESSPSLTPPAMSLPGSPSGPEPSAVLAERRSVTSQPVLRAEAPPKSKGAGLRRAVRPEPAAPIGQGTLPREKPPVILDVP